MIARFGGVCVGQNSWETESTFTHACTHVVVLTQEHEAFKLGRDAGKVRRSQDGSIDGPLGPSVLYLPLLCGACARAC